MLEYSPDTGMFRHVPPCSNNARQEWHAGSDEHGRCYSVWFDGRNQRAHRVAWFLHHGTWPTGTIDHINGNPKDNRMDNLRDVSQQVNNRHILVARLHNHVGVLGVTKWRSKYRARITVNGRSMHLGVFDTHEAASAVYQLAKLAYH